MSKMKSQMYNVNVNVNKVPPECTLVKFSYIMLRSNMIGTALLCSRNTGKSFLFPMSKFKCHL